MFIFFGDFEYFVCLTRVHYNSKQLPWNKYIMQIVNSSFKQIAISKEKSVLSSLLSSPPDAELTINLNTIQELANLIFYDGSVQALPIRIKILFDRLLAQIETEDALKLLNSFGWSLQDYARGYILKV